MTRDLLTLPAFTVTLESAFNTGGRVQTDTRNCLASDAIEMTISGRIAWMRKREVKIK